ncbi:MAG: response regulator transcription factor [Erythrobacter sp.]
MSGGVVRIGILEDDDDMRDYLVSVIEAQPDMQLAFCCASLHGAIGQLRSGKTPDLCLVDLDLPDGRGSDFVAKLTQTSQAKALILTVLGDRESVMTGFSAGAHGYLLKDTEPPQVVQHMQDTIAGASPISAQVSTYLLDHYLKNQSKTSDATDPIDALTKREVDVLTLFAKGLSYRETAEALGISAHTVNDYVKSVYSKLSVNSRNEAVYEAMQLGWITI